MASQVAASHNANEPMQKLRFAIFVAWPMLVRKKRLIIGVSMLTLKTHDVSE